MPPTITYAPPPSPRTHSPCGKTDACENIIFPKLFLRTVIIYFSYSGVGCHDPGPVANGNRQGNAPFHCQSVVTYTCQPGYNLYGSISLHCLDNGVWNAEPPVCIPQGERIGLTGVTCWNNPPFISHPLTIYGHVTGFFMGNLKDFVIRCVPI